MLWGLTKYVVGAPLPNQKQTELLNLTGNNNGKTY
jgi:hypothetical protein